MGMKDDSPTSSTASYGMGLAQDRASLGAAMSPSQQNSRPYFNLYSSQPPAVDAGNVGSDSKVHSACMPPQGVEFSKAESSSDQQDCIRNCCDLLGSREAKISDTFMSVERDVSSDGTSRKRTRKTYSRPAAENFIGPCLATCSVAKNLLVSRFRSQQVQGGSAYGESTGFWATVSNMLKSSNYGQKMITGTAVPATIEGPSTGAEIEPSSLERLDFRDERVNQGRGFGRNEEVSGSHKDYGWLRRHQDRPLLNSDLLSRNRETEQQFGVKPTQHSSTKPRASPDRLKFAATRGPHQQQEHRRQRESSGSVGDNSLYASLFDERSFQEERGLKRTKHYHNLSLLGHDEDTAMDSMGDDV